MLWICAEPVRILADNTMAVLKTQVFTSTSLCAVASQFRLTGLGVTSPSDIKPPVAMTSTAPAAPTTSRAKCGMAMQSTAQPERYRW